jgi:hypothetical protein
MKRIVVAAALLTCAGFAQAENFSLDANGHAVAAAFDGSLGHSSGAQGAYEAGGLFRSNNGTHYKDGYVGLKVVGDMGAAPLKVDASIGLRGLYVDGEDVSGEVVALAGSVDARLPQINRVVFSATGLYSPDPLSFGNAKEYAELDLNVGYEVLRNARLYAGYRNIGIDFGDGRHTVDNGFLGGLRLTF